MAHQREGSTKPRAEHIEFPGRRGNTLVGEIYRAAANAPLLVLCHGMESTRGGTKQTAIVEEFVPLGYSVLRFDFSYVGDSEGSFQDMTIRGEVDDLNGALDFAREFSPPSTVVIGSSLGGAVALLATADRQDTVTAVATIAAVADSALFTASLSEQAVQAWRDTGKRAWGESYLKSTFLQDVESLDIPAALFRISCPVLAMHGDVDDVVPIAHARLIERTVSGPARVEVFEGVGHRFDEPGALDALLACLRRWLPSAGAAP